MSTSDQSSEMVDVEVPSSNQVYVQRMTRAEYEQKIAQGVDLVLVEPD